MIFSVSSDGIERSLNRGPDSVFLTVKDVVREITLNSNKLPLPAWCLLSSQKQIFWINHLAKFPITPNQEGTMEMRDKMFRSVGAQDKDISGHQLSAMNDVELYWKKEQLDVDAAFRPGIETHFHQQRLTTWRSGNQQKAPTLPNKEVDKSSTPITPVSERQTQPLE